MARIKPEMESDGKRFLRKVKGCILAYDYRSGFVDDGRDRWRYRQIFK